MTSNTCVAVLGAGHAGGPAGRGGAPEVTPRAASAARPGARVLPQGMPSECGRRLLPLLPLCHVLHPLTDDGGS
ncbi:hypothetical protein [Streptomyces sp. NPDC008092]|uniref:hypothetical protein n=1 Tax=Streptomyces sp. NPDC008092 TaxID=3364808 RepID=UPI0036EAC816